MSKSVKITLGEISFDVPALNIGQLQDVSEVISKATSGAAGFDIIKIALKRADPKPDYETLAPTIDEIGAGVQAVLKLSGLQKPDGNPPVA